MGESDPFLQPDGETLKNRLGIVADPEELKIHEREYSTERVETVHEDVAGNFDAAHIRAIHRHIFQDVYEWAGTTRADTITLEGQEVNVPAALPELSKGSTDFAASRYVNRGLDAIAETANSAGAMSSDPAEFSQAAAGVLSGLNFVHPFREGNGRTQRVFLEQLAERAGHTLDFDGVTAERMTLASIEAINDNPEPFRAIIAESLDAERVALRLEAVAALEKTGVEADDFWIETASNGQRVRGVFLAREENHVSVVTDDNHFVIMPAVEQTVRFARGDVVNMVFQSAREIDTPAVRRSDTDLEL